MISEKQHDEYLLRIEELLKVVSNSTPADDLRNIELGKISDLVADYQEEYFPIGIPSLIDVIKLRMEEKGLKQKDLAELLGTTTSRISEYIRGKREITLHMAKQLHKKLDIDAEIILQ